MRGGTVGATYARATLAAVARSVRSEILSVVEMPTDDQRAVQGAVFCDPAERPVISPGAVALAIGLSLSSKRIGTTIRELSDAGYVAVVYKRQGASDNALREAARKEGLALFQVLDSVPWRHIAEIIDAAIVPYSARALAGIHPGDLFHLANIVAEQLGGAIAIADPEQTILAYSTLPEQPIDDTRRDAILRLHVPHSAQTDLDYRRVHKSREPLDVASGEDGQLRRTAIAVRAGDTVLGSLWLLERADQHHADTNRILHEAANVAALHILHNRTSHASNLTRQIELVQPLLFDPDRAPAAALKLGILTESIRIAALGISLPEASHPDSFQFRLRFFETVRNACAVWLPAAVCGLSERIVYIVLPQTTQSSREFERSAVHKIVQSARRLLLHPVVAGLGVEAPTGRLEISRTDAELVLAELMHRIPREDPAAGSTIVVADADSLGSRLYLRQIASALTAAGHLPGLHAQKIADYDALHQKSFGQTIYAYLKCGGNAVDAAIQLDVHVNTVRYRLSRVESLFGIDLNDPDTRLLVWFQLWFGHN